MNATGKEGIAKGGGGEVHVVEPGTVYVPQPICLHSIFKSSGLGDLCAIKGGLI